jgi:hypothetical protein
MELPEPAAPSNDFRSEQSWFEDGPDVVEAIAGARSHNRAKLATYLLQSVMTRHRHKWADLFLRTSIWMHESRGQEESCWRELALIAKAVASGRDLSEIGLMRDIAGLQEFERVSASWRRLI